MDSQLTSLADLIRSRNSVERGIAEIVGRPMQLGHIGEFIASRIFDVRLEASASHKRIDGTFGSGLLVGRTVNVKWYAKRENLLDLHADDPPDFYLILAGPKSLAESSRRQTRPWVVTNVYLFDSVDLLDELGRRGVKIGVATSIAEQTWIGAEIFPESRSRQLRLTDEQRKLLSLFGLG